MEMLKYIIPISGALALLCAAGLSLWIRKRITGNDKMREISSFIQEGAMAFLMREYRTILIFIAVMFLALTFIPGLGIRVAVTFVCGALFSMLAGFFGMRVATRANVRTAAAAQFGGMKPALQIAFRGGAVMGLCVVGFGVLGIGLVFCLTGTEHLDLFTGFSLGASAIALFGRVGGGIYTKAADVGADLVGKVEAGIPEDDPRNPAVIADNVGDNVGDVAGMGSDLYESYVGALVSAILLAVARQEVAPFEGALYPLLLAAIGIAASIIAIFIAGAGKAKNPSCVLNAGTYISGAICLISAFFLSIGLFDGQLKAFYAVAIGLLVGIGIGALTEYFTSARFRPVKHIASQCETGSATCIIDGLSTGMLSTVLPVILIAVGILLAFSAFGLYGIALAAVGMLSTAGITIAVDAYGPISDNAGGIAEMAGLPEDVRTITDTLDSVGNTTAAVGKGFAIGSAALTALALFVSYSQTANIEIIDLLDPYVVSSLFLGAMLPFLFTALSMRSVGRAAYDMIEEVRRQFKDKPGIMSGAEKPDYGKCVDISTGAALREMILPGVIAIVSPLLVGFILGPVALGGLLAGSLVTGVMLAIMMANAGGAWDNAKKYIESREENGKGSRAHKAAVVGDTVGDPFKDTAGPSINILIKLMTIVAVVFLPLFL